MPSRRTLIPKDSPLARYRPPKLDPLAAENWVEHADTMLKEELDLLESGSSATVDPGLEVPIPLGCRFSTRSARLTLADRENLEKLAPTLAGRDGRIEVVGACAPEEGADHRERLELSLQRARAVVRYLEEARVPAGRLHPIGIGAVDAGTRRGESMRRVTLRWFVGDTGTSER
jgi:outer membrane protein OmpA-like peptidoglycan-associated protein